MRVLSGKRAWLECVILIRVLAVCAVLLALRAASQMLVVMTNLAKEDPQLLEEALYLWDHVHSTYDFLATLPTLLYSVIMATVGHGHYEVVAYLSAAVVLVAAAAALLDRLGPVWARRLVAGNRGSHV